MSNEIIITPNLGTALVSASDQARVDRDALLVDASMFSAITDQIDVDSATPVLRSLGKFKAEIEKQRTEAKAPILDIGRKIDALAKELTLDVEIEEKRISRLLGSYEADERRKAQELQWKAAEEARRITREAEVKAREAARAVEGEEAKARASDAVVEAAQAQIVAVKQQVANQAPVKTEGSRLTKKICFEVTSIADLYAAHPTLCIVEPNGSAIRAILKQNPNLIVPGLKHWTEESLNVK